MYTEQQINEWKSKAEKWDALEDAIFENISLTYKPKTMNDNKAENMHTSDTGEKPVLAACCDICSTPADSLKEKAGLNVCSDCLDSEPFCLGCGAWLGDADEYYQREGYCSDCL